MDDKIIPVKVAVRIRPLSKKENNEGCQTALERVEKEPQVWVHFVALDLILRFAIEILHRHILGLHSKFREKFYL